MTVTASPADVQPWGYTTPGSPSGPVPNNANLGKGQTLLNGIAAMQILLNSLTGRPSYNSVAMQLNMLQIEAVDYFMGSYWVSADQILAQMYPAQFILPKAGDAYVTGQLAKITTRTAQVNALIASAYTQVGTPPGGIFGNWPQYSVGYPETNSGYPLTGPDVQLYALQQDLINYCMNKAILPAATILSFMTGAQTYAWNGYASGYTWFQPYWDDY